jgi:hypothetical protein
MSAVNRAVHVVQSGSFLGMYPSAVAFLTAIKDIMPTDLEAFRKILECDSVDLVPLIQVVVSLPEEGGLVAWRASTSGEIMRPDVLWNQAKDSVALHFIAMGERQAATILDLPKASQSPRIDAIMLGKEAAQFNMIVDFPKHHLFRLIFLEL